MMHHSTMQALGQARLAELHRRACRNHSTVQALGQARLAELHRRACRARRQQSGPRAAGILAAATAWARRPRPAPESS
jgi:hypothetical protein